MKPRRFPRDCKTCLTKMYTHLTLRFRLFPHDRLQYKPARPSGEVGPGEQAAICSLGCHPILNLLPPHLHSQQMQRDNKHWGMVPWWPFNILRVLKTFIWFSELSTPYSNEYFKRGPVTLASSISQSSGSLNLFLLPGTSPHQGSSWPSLSSLFRSYGHINP